ncbi:MAG: hypothetical protein AAF515_01975 [Pseudomonadota bacterium]
MTNFPRLFVAVLFVLTPFLGGCVSSAPQIVQWTHPMSGEYLFAFDHENCATESSGDLASPVFFSCMTSLGYYQVGEPGPAGPAGTTTVSLAR